MRIINLNPSQTSVIEKSQLSPERRSQIIEILRIGIIYAFRIRFPIFMSKVVPARSRNSDLNIPRILLSDDRLHKPEFVEGATLPGMSDLAGTEDHGLGRKLPRRQRLDVWEILPKTEGFHVCRDAFEAGDVVEECAEEYYRLSVRFSRIIQWWTNESACIRHL